MYYSFKNVLYGTITINIINVSMERYVVLNVPLTFIFLTCIWCIPLKVKATMSGYN